MAPIGTQRVSDKLFPAGLVRHGACSRANETGSGSEWELNVAVNVESSTGSWSRLRERNRERRGLYYDLNLHKTRNAVEDKITFFVS